MIEFIMIANLEDRKHADLLVLPFWKGAKKAEPAANFSKYHALFSAPLETNDFVGDEGEILILYTADKPEQRLALLGLGDQEKISVERLRRSYTSLVKVCRKKKLSTLNVMVPKVAALPGDAIARGLTEGMLLTNYAFDHLKHDVLKASPTSLVKKCTLIGLDKSGQALAKKSVALVEAVNFARDLVNGNADDVTPQHLAHVAKQLASSLSHVKTTVLNRAQIVKEKMGLLLAVSRGAHCDPAFIVVEYQGNPRSKDLTVLVGKGITYDTGGLNIKVSGMETMKGDMGGAATVLGTLMAAAKMGLKTNVTAIVPAAENAIDAKSYKPGDVYKSYSGKTVEIGNTDAEGRLILADALAYAVKKLKPTRIIDVATLTGAMVVALGAETTGLMSNSDALADALIRAGHETYERLCRFPIYEEYRDTLKSDIADIKNIGSGRYAGAITAAMFLKEFVGDIPWAHCDIAGTAFLSEPLRYNPKYGTGVGVRFLIEFLENL